MKPQLFGKLLLVIMVVVFLATRIEELMGGYFLNLGTSGLAIAESARVNGQINRAKANLQSALLWNPDNLNAHRMLGRAFLHDWQVAPAQDSIRSFGSSTSNFFWAAAELNAMRCATLQEQNGNVVLWQQAGITGNEFLTWFAQSLSSATLADENKASISCQNLSTPVVVEDAIILTGKDLGEFATDERIKVRSLYQDRENILAIYANRTVRKTLIVQEPAHYAFRLLALNSFPPPVMIRVAVNNNSVGIFSFEAGNETWTDKSQKLFLEGGVYLLEVSFLNDAQVKMNGQTFDRNAYIASLSVERAD